MKPEEWKLENLSAYANDILALTATGVKEMVWWVYELLEHKKVYILFSGTTIQGVYLKKPSAQIAKKALIKAHWDPDELLIEEHLIEDLPSMSRKEP